MSWLKQTRDFVAPAENIIAKTGETLGLFEVEMWSI
jgi:hypothetical protein